MATYIKVGGTWRTVSGDTESVCGYTKVGGVWKAVSDTYVKVAGTWRSVCAPTPPPPPPPPPPPDGGGGPVDPPQDSSVSSLSPSSGEAAGGYTVTLNGSFPSNLSNISVNGTYIGNYSRVSSTAWSFTMPAGTAGTTVQVQAYNGRTPLMGALTFTYNPVVVPPSCVNGNLCGNIIYADGTVVSINQINGTFNGSLRTEACGNGGTRTQAYTCVTPVNCPNISVGVGQCVGETPTSGCGIMPDVVGLTESQASTLIVNKGINYEYTYDRTAGATAANDGTVYSQDPPAGTNVGSCNNSYNAGLTIYRYSAPPTPTCVCTPLTSVAGSPLDVPTSTCASGRQNVTYETYNSCCVTNGTVASSPLPVYGACVPQSTECSGAACSEARCRTCAALGTGPPNSYPSTRSVSTSVCASGTMNTYICYTPGSCANIPEDTGCVAVQNCTPVYSYTEGRQCVQTCGSGTTNTSVAIYTNPCTGAESWTCPACTQPYVPPVDPPVVNCQQCNGTYPNSCGTYGDGTLCVTPLGCPNRCIGGETPPAGNCTPVRIYYENEYGDYCTALQNPCTNALTSVSCS